MAIVEGQIETLKKLKEALNRSGITRFNSVGEIDRFIKNYETEKQQLASHIESALEAEIQANQATLIRRQQVYEELKAGIRKEITQKGQDQTGPTVRTSKIEPVVCVQKETQLQTIQKKS